MKKAIQVRHYSKGEDHFTSKDFLISKIIWRKAWFEAIGNFNPMFCRYNGMRCLVNSDKGDISDPFRREENYLESLFISV